MSDADDIALLRRAKLERQFKWTDNSPEAARALDELVGHLYELKWRGWLDRIVTQPNGMTPHGQYYAAVAFLSEEGERVLTEHDIRARDQ
jgi:hypothetical protein